MALRCGGIDSGGFNVFLIRYSDRAVVDDLIENRLTHYCTMVRDDILYQI